MNSDHSYFITAVIKLTLSTANDERNMPRVAMKPPVNAVFLIPNLSTRILEIGDKRNVVPIAKDATRDAFKGKFTN